MIICANWKMNLNEKQSVNLVKDINKVETNNQIIIFPSNINLFSVSRVINNKISLGCQNFYTKNEGPFTGETSLDQFPKNVNYVLIGHSERRVNFFEDDKLIKQKIVDAIDKNYKIILCIGETEKIYRENKTLEYILKQLKNVMPSKLDNIIIAYEPIWAIGSGYIPKAEDIVLIISKIKSLYNLEVLYGGSVNNENIKEFAKIENLSGFLIGGTSLNSEKFIQIIKNLN